MATNEEVETINRDTHWKCERCGVVCPYVDDESYNDDPKGLDSGPPHFNLIGYYCEDCIGDATEEHEADLLASRGDPLEFPKDIPADPKVYYAAEWKGWRDFLGVPPDSPICDDCGSHPCECQPETTPRTRT